MKARIIFGSIIMTFVLALPSYSGGNEQLQKYFSDAASKVKATDNPAEKREILNESFQTMSKALDRVENSGLISKSDLAGIQRFKAALQEKQDELQGNNGFVRVSDVQLNSFSNYVVQEMEQAELLTISIVTVLLIILVVIIFF